MSQQQIERMDLVCTQHNNATLKSEGKVTILVPIDKYSDEVDFSLGWEFDFDELSCPIDPEGECVDHWQALLVL